MAKKFKPVKEMTVKELAQPSTQVLEVDSDEDMEKLIAAMKLRAARAQRGGN